MPDFVLAEHLLIREDGPFPILVCVVFPLFGALHSLLSRLFTENRLALLYVVPESIDFEGGAHRIVTNNNIVLTAKVLHAILRCVEGAFEEEFLELGDHLARDFLRPGLVLQRLHCFVLLEASDDALDRLFADSEPSSDLPIGEPLVVHSDNFDSFTLGDTRVTLRRALLASLGSFGP